MRGLPEFAVFLSAMLLVLAPAMGQNRVTTDTLAIDPDAFANASFIAQIDGLARPMGVAIGVDGLVYIAEAGRHRIAVFNRQGEFVRAIGKRGCAQGELRMPCGVAISAHSDIVVADTGNNRIQVFDHDGRSVRIVGQRGTAGGWCAPSAVAIEGELIAVADSGNQCCKCFDNEGVAGVFGSDGTRSLLLPGAVAFAGHGRLRVIDSWQHEIVSLNFAGPLVRHGSYGTFPGQFNQPSGCATFGDSLVIADTLNHRLQLLDKTCNPVANFAHPGRRPHDGAGLLRCPNAVAIAPDTSFMAVCEATEQRCQLFALRRNAPESVNDQPLPPPLSIYGPRFAIHDGMMALWLEGEQSLIVADAAPPHHSVTETGSYGRRFGQFEHIVDMLFLADNEPNHARMLIADEALHHIMQIRIDLSQRDALGNATVSFVNSVDVSALLNSAGPLATMWPTRPDAIELGPDGGIFVLDARNAIIAQLDGTLTLTRTFGSYGDAPGEFLLPVDMAFDQRDRTLNVLDRLACTIQKFDETGEVIMRFGGYGDGPGLLLDPTALAVDASNGDLYVCDAGAARIVCFTADGRFQRAFGTRGSANGELAYPTDIAVTDDGLIAVFDASHQRLIFFAKDGAPQRHFGARSLAPLPKPAWRD